MPSLLTVRKTLVISVALALTGCAGNVKNHATLADLNAVEIPAEQAPLPQVSLDEITGHYKSVLDITQDPEIRLKVLRRLAGLEMLRSENEQMSSAQSQQYYNEAIGLYEEILNNHPDRVDNDRLLYQMAKAYELDGRRVESMAILDQITRDYPNSSYQTEVQFRRGEILFSEGDYKHAELAYKRVVEAGDSSSYYQNSVYMHGWALFKQGRYRPSLRSFTTVLDKLLVDTTEVESLPSSSRSMAKDTLRVMSLSFSYLEGAYTINEVYSVLGVRQYEHLLYDSLGKLYLEKERFRDSADTYLEFVKNFPNSDHAPYFSVQAIDVYDNGGFPSLILPAKEQFVSNYGISSQFWAERDEPKREAIKPYLHTYLGELASYYHAQAQDLQAAHKKQQKKPPTDASKLITEAEIQQAWLKAADWYAGFTRTFPDDKATPAKVFLMAECFYEAKDLPAAIDAFERVAYDYPGAENGADAGYAAILAAEEHLQSLAGEDRASWHAHKVFGTLRFADTYPQDQRAVPVLARSSEELLELEDYDDAIVIATRVTGWQPTPDKDLLSTAWLVQGHSQFALNNYQQAEIGYQGALRQMSRKDKRHDDVVDRLAASVYKQGEQQMAAGETTLAVASFLRVGDVAPGSAIAATAQYDAGSYLMEMGSWVQAETVLTGWRSANVSHALAATLPAKLAEVYQQQEKWGKAADELAVMAVNDPDESVQRQSLYLSAQLYQKDGNTRRAVVQYRDYVKAYPQPFDLATEARFELSELYLAEGNQKNRNFWLTRLVDSHDTAGAQSTDRSLYLAAWATSLFAETEFNRFKNAQLKLPLKRSLKKKKTAMKKTLGEYEKVLNYGVADFVTEASYRIGEVYVLLGQDLMDSQRPKGLDALELEQYELLLEEQAYPFEEKGIAIHEANAQRSWSGTYDKWTQKSFDSLAKLLPARYGKQEQIARSGYEIY